MTLKTTVKVGNITNLSDARYCAGMGVDMLGFKIGEGIGQVNLVKFKEITDWISGPEFVNELPEKISEDSEKHGIKLIEFPASEISSLNSLMSDHNFIIRIELSEWEKYKEELQKHKDLIKYLLVTNSNGWNEMQSKSIVVDMAIEFAVLLGLEMKVGLLENYLTWPIAGLALNGSEETSPGIKDYDQLSLVLEKLELD